MGVGFQARRPTSDRPRHEVVDTGGQYGWPQKRAHRPRGLRYDRLFQSPRFRGGRIAVNNWPREAEGPPQATLRDQYQQTYGAFAEDVYAAVRHEVFRGEDFGQNSWHT